MADQWTCQGTATMKPCNKEVAELTSLSQIIKDNIKGFGYLDKRGAPRACDAHLVRKWNNHLVTLFVYFEVCTNFNSFFHLAYQAWDAESLNYFSGTSLESGDP